MPGASGNPGGTTGLRLQPRPRSVPCSPADPNLALQDSPAHPILPCPSMLLSQAAPPTSRLPCAQAATPSATARAAGSCLALWHSRRETLSPAQPSVSPPLVSSDSQTVSCGGRAGGVLQRPPLRGLPPLLPSLAAPGGLAAALQLSFPWQEQGPGRRPFLKVTGTTRPPSGSSLSPFPPAPSHVGLKTMTRSPGLWGVSASSTHAARPPPPMACPWTSQLCRRA